MNKLGKDQLGMAGKEIRKIEAKDGEIIVVRPFSLRDLGKLQQMNRLISAESRKTYEATIPRPMPPVTRPGTLLFWALMEIKMAFSCVGPVRKFLMYFPRLTFITFVAVNSSDEIVGFRFYNILGRRAKHKYIAEDGILLRDDYQGRGIGTRFLAISIKLASNDIYLVIALINTLNKRSYHIFEKVGYKRLGTYKKDDGTEEYFYIWVRGMEQPPPDESDSIKTETI